MEDVMSPGDLIVVSKVESPAAALIINSSGGTGIIISSQLSKIVNTNQSIKMYKVLIDGKISHITKDRIVRVLNRRGTNREK